MKKTMVKKIFFILITILGILLILSSPNEAASQMIDVTSRNVNTKLLGSDAGIYQTAINCYMDTSITIDSEIANTRTYYGEGETLKVRFSFSRDISSTADLKLGIKFGSSTERVITDVTTSGSYLIFSYDIQSDDQGGLTITFIEGTVTDSSSNTISLGILGSENTWTNTIIAKGAWTKYTVSNYKITFTSDTIGTAGYAYVLDNNEIRPITYSDVKILDTTTGKITDGTESTITITYSGKAVVSIVPKDGSSIIYVDNACDIAGNTGFACNISSKAYVVDCTGNAVNDIYYCKEGTTVTILTIGCTLDDVYVDGASGNGSITTQTTLSESSSIYIYVYTVASGDNGYITCDYSTFSNCYIADTTAPTAELTQIYLNSGTAYYSETDNAADNTNGTTLSTGSSYAVTSGTIWAKKNAKFTYKYSASDNIAISSFAEEGQGTFTNSSESYSNSGTTGTYTSVIVATEEGISGIYLEVTDCAGNVLTKYITSNVTLICDTTGPSVSITSDNLYTNEAYVNFDITVSDPDIDSYLGSGVICNDTYKSVAISNVVVTNGTVIGSSTSGNTLNVTVVPNADGYVSVYVPAGATTDNVGNSSTASAVTKIYVDSTAPVITSITGVPDTWVDEATLSVIATDSGVGGIQYSFSTDGSTWTDYSDDNTYTVTENCTVYVKVADSLGNESEVVSVEITYITSSDLTIDLGSYVSSVETADDVNYIIVPDGTTVSELLSCITTSSDVTVGTTDSDDSISSDSILATNEILKINGNYANCIIVVKGDVTGDGAINMSDVLKLNQYRNGNIGLTTAEFLAGNVVDSDDEITMSDILKINQYRLGNISEL